MILVELATYKKLFSMKRVSAEECKPMQNDANGRATTQRSTGKIKVLARVWTSMLGLGNERTTAEIWQSPYTPKKLTGTII